MRIAAIAMNSNAVNNNLLFNNKNHLNIRPNNQYYTADTVSFGRRLPREIRKNSLISSEDMDCLDRIFNIKDKGGHYVYGGRDLERLMKQCPDQLDAFCELASFKDSEGDLLATREEALTLIDYYPEHDNTVHNLLYLSKKNSYVDSFNNPTNDYIPHMIKTYEKYPNVFTEVANKRKLSPEYARYCSSFDTVIDLTPILAENPREINSLINMKDLHGNHRFDDYGVLALAPAYIECPDEVEKLSNMLIVTEKEHRFSAYDIANLVQMKQKYKDNHKVSELVDKLISMKDDKGNYLHDANSIIKFIETCVKGYQTVLNFFMPF